MLSLVASLALCPLPALQGSLTAGEAQQPLPRHATEAEKLYLESNPIQIEGARAVTPPVGDVRCPAEYEPMAGLIISWQGPTAWTAILARIAAAVTTTGNAKIWVAVDNASEATTALNTIAARGGDTSKVITMIYSTTSIWMRDYGPRYVYQGEVRGFVDHTYNLPRPEDNLFPRFFGGQRKHRRHRISLIHGGGNYHLDALGDGYATELIVNENPALTPGEIHDRWLDYQRVSTEFFPPLPTSVDGTQHLDMWMQVAADDVVVISDWPTQSGTFQDQICDQAAIDMAAKGYTVHRIPAVRDSSHYTYTNVVMCNDVVLVPSYTNANVSGFNAQALAVWQAAVPNKTVQMINCEGIVSAAGVMHCIVMHVPEHLGGVNPTAYLAAPQVIGAKEAGSSLQLDWVADDDEAVTSVDLLYSTDGGATFPTTIASGLNAKGVMTWSLPVGTTRNAVVRAVAHDADGNQGHFDSPPFEVLPDLNARPIVGGIGTGRR